MRWHAFFRRAVRSPHLQLGLWGERQAERFLKARGIKILGRRVKVGKFDEVDLLGREGNVLVIIEVKTRATEGWEAPRRAVDARKRYRLSRAAARYARQLVPAPDHVRFDIVEIIGTPGEDPPEIRHHAAAFSMHHAFRL